MYADELTRFEGASFSAEEKTDLTPLVGQTLQVEVPGYNSGSENDNYRELEIKGVAEDGRLKCAYKDDGTEVTLKYREEAYDINIQTISYEDHELKMEAKKQDPNVFDATGYKFEKEPFYVSVLSNFRKIEDGKVVLVDEMQYMKDNFFADGAPTPLLLEGPTGTGKTRALENLAYQLDAVMFNVVGNEDLSSNDLVGRFIVKGDEIVWQDGPLTASARYSQANPDKNVIFYFDEIAEGRNDVLAKLNPLLDHQRRIVVEKKGGEVLNVSDNFLFVAADNPEYQKTDMKPSLRQRFTCIGFDYLREKPLYEGDTGFDPEDKGNLKLQKRYELEQTIVTHESGVGPTEAKALVDYGIYTRNQSISKSMREPASPRLLINAGKIMQNNYVFGTAVQHAIIDVITPPIYNNKDFVDRRTAFERQADIIGTFYHLPGHEVDEDVDAE